MTVLSWKRKKVGLHQNLDKGNIVINKNYGIKVNKCKINILNITFVNRKTIVNEEFIYSNSDLTDVVFIEEIDFEKIKINQFENILMYHKSVSYRINIIVLLMIAFLVKTYAGYKKCCRKNKGLNVNIELYPTATNSSGTVESWGWEGIWNESP